MDGQPGAEGLPADPVAADPVATLAEALAKLSPADKAKLVDLLTQPQQ